MPESRYARQEAFERIGPAGQRRLAAASAIVVGCGALGTHIAENLARAGIGRLRLVDRDLAELHNLQRQALLDEDDCRAARPKALAAADHLRKINSSLALDAQHCELTADNAPRLLEGFDVVMDGCDNVPARQALNLACLASGTPCVFGAAAGATGMVFPMVPGRTPCYRCLFPQTPPPDTVQTAATAGMLHATPAIVAALQCVAALRLLLGSFEPSDEVLWVDVWDAELTPTRVPRRPECPACGRAPRRNPS